jgi:hypothetical protein
VGEKAAQRVVLRFKELIQDVEPAMAAGFEEMMPELLSGVAFTLSRWGGVGAGA